MRDTDLRQESRNPYILFIHFYTCSSAPPWTLTVFTVCSFCSFSVNAMPVAPAQKTKTVFFFFNIRKELVFFWSASELSQNPTPDRQQNSCRLQINVGCNSTAIRPRLQLLTASPKTPPASSRNPASDSFSALMPDPRPRRPCVCVCARGCVAA